MPMNPIPPKIPPTIASNTDAREALVPVRARMLGNQIVGLVDHDGNDLGMPVTAVPSGSGPAPGDSGIVDEVSVSGTAGIAASPLPEQQEKILHRASATEISIITKPAIGKPLLWGLTYNNFTNTDSGGTKCEWWRQKRLIELADAVLYSTAAASATSGAGWGLVTNIECRPGFSDGGQRVDANRTIVPGEYKDYAITVPASGRVGVVFGVSASAPEAVTLTCGAATATVDIRRTITVAGKLEVSIAYLTGCTPGAGTLRVTHAGTSGKNMYVLGPLVADINMMMPKAIPANTALVATFDLSGRVIDSNGAVEMAMYDTATSKFVGSYHGLMSGSSDFMEGGSVVDVSATGSVTMFRDFGLRQSGDLAGKLAYETLHRFRSASELACQIALNGSITVSAAYQAMTTANIAWTTVDGTDYPNDGVKYPVAGKGRFVQYAPGTPNKRLVAALHELVLNGVPQLPGYAHMQVTTSGPYAKLRTGVIDAPGAPITINSLRYTVSHRLAVSPFTG